jgi:hypothetical protein
MKEELNKLNKGDYVLATKWSDGDPQDAWCVGFFSHMLCEDRYIVVDGEDKPFRANGYRRAKRISFKRGSWLLSKSKEIEMSSRSVWGWLRIRMNCNEEEKS